MTTLIAFGMFLGLSLAGFVLWGLCLRVGLRWAKVDNVTTRRIVAAVLLTHVFQISAYVLLTRATPQDRIQSMILLLSWLCVVIVIPCLVVSRLFRTNLIRAFQAWLLTLITPVASLLFAVLAVRFVVEAFVLSSISMAPILLGPHLTGVCPGCGEMCYVSESDLQFQQEGLRTDAICENFHLTEIGQTSDEVGRPDRILVAKYLNPRRWDLVVFRPPDEPSTAYAMRLVGLPGEEIVIEDGAVWADGERLTPPESIRRIEYVNTFDDAQPWLTIWGSPDQPARLAEDEYFVLGDFSPRSRDSRLWQTGAPGHPPYAVPTENIVGVVTHIYWPMNRWSIFR